MRISLIALVACTGTQGSLLATPPPESWGTLTTDVIGITAGYSHSCALNRDGSIACWGSNFSHQAEAPYGSFTAIAGGEDHTCGLRIDQTISCWGDPDMAASPPGRFTQISAGGGIHTCGLRVDGAVVCWGWNNNHFNEPPAGPFVDVSVGNGACAIRPSGAVACWSGYERPATPSSSRLVAIDVGIGNTTCGIRASGNVECWASKVAPASVTTERFVTISNSVGIRDDGTLAYLPAVAGYYYFGDVPKGRFIALSASYSHACAVRDDGSVQCWGTDWSGESTPPPAEPR